MSKQSKRHMGAKIKSAEGVDAITVADDGNVGIGTDSPLRKLHLSAGYNTGGMILGADIDSTNTTNNTIKVGRIVALPYASDGATPYGVISAVSTSATNAVEIGPNTSELPAPDQLKFMTSPFPGTGTKREVMTIQAVEAGKDTVSIASSIGAPNAPLSVYNETVGATNYIFAGKSNVGGTKVIRWRVECDGDTISSTGSYTSDVRAKKNLEPIKYGLKQVLQLEPKSFNWWHEEDTDTKSFCISTAQEVQAIMPEMVRDDGLEGPNSEPMKAIYDKELLAVMVKAIQELKAELDEAKAEIAALKVK